jgi:hypothetical protein
MSPRILPVSQPSDPHHLVEAPQGTTPAREEASPDSGGTPPGGHTTSHSLVRSSSSPLFSVPLNRIDKIQRPSEERPVLKLYRTLRGTGPRQAAPVKRTNKCCVVPTVLASFSPVPHPDRDN